jgi:sRNA-binding protein
MGKGETIRKTTDLLLGAAKDYARPTLLGGAAGAASGVGVASVKGGYGFDKGKPQEKTKTEHIYDTGTLGASIGAGGALGRAAGSAILLALLKKRSQVTADIGKTVGEYGGTAAGAAGGYLLGKRRVDKRHQYRQFKQKDKSELEMEEGSDMAEKEAKAHFINSLLEKQALTGTLFGTGAGAFEGMMRPKDEGKGRAKTILRSMLHGGSTGLGMDVGSIGGGLAGGAIGAIPGAAMAGYESLTADEPNYVPAAAVGTGGALLGSVLGSITGSMAGAGAGHRIGRRRTKEEKAQKAEKKEQKAKAKAEKKESKAQKEAKAYYINQMKEAELSDFDLGNLGTTIPAVGTAIGGLVGSMRKQDPDETRLQAILRSAGTGLATGLGSELGGEAADALTKGSLTNLAAEPVGNIAGALAAYHAAKRKSPRQRQRSMRRAAKQQFEEQEFLKNLQEQYPIGEQV